MVFFLSSDSGFYGSTAEYVETIIDTGDGTCTMQTSSEDGGYWTTYIVEEDGCFTILGDDGYDYPGYDLVLAWYGSAWLEVDSNCIGVDERGTERIAMTLEEMLYLVEHGDEHRENYYDYEFHIVIRDGKIVEIIILYAL